MRYGLKFFATAQSSRERDSDLDEEKFAADDVCPLEVERVSVKRLTEDGHTLGIAVPAMPIPQRSSSAPREQVVWICQ